MPPLQRRFDRGRSVALQVRVRLGQELRQARTAAGLSQSTLAAMAGMSQPKVPRMERAKEPMVALESWAILFAILGLTFVARTYPEGSPARDAGHGRLLGRFVALLPPVIAFPTEVPLGRSAAVRPGDPRAWDGELRAGSDRCKVEAETVLADFQALDRRIAVKMEDDDVDRVILVVADTRRNREILRLQRELLRSRFPLDSRDILRELRAGRLPSRGGIVLV